MRIISTYEGHTKTLEGDTLITFCAPEIETEQLEKLEGEKVVLNVEKLFGKRSLSANAYLWLLCTEISKVIGHCSKDIIYLRMLRDFGVYEDYRVPRASIPTLKKVFRLVEEFESFEGEEIVQVRCYLGSSHYDVKQMQALLQGVVDECELLGIQTWDQAEIDNLINEWGKANGK